jgi:hypothetical protein
MALSNFGRLVLNLSKYLIRLPNTRAKDHQWVGGASEGSLVVPTIGQPVSCFLTCCLASYFLTFFSLVGTLTGVRMPEQVSLWEPVQGHPWSTPIGNLDSGSASFLQPSQEPIFGVAADAECSQLAIRQGDRSGTAYEASPVEHHQSHELIGATDQRAHPL